MAKKHGFKKIWWFKLQTPKLNQLCLCVPCMCLCWMWWTHYFAWSSTEATMCQRWFKWFHRWFEARCVHNDLWKELWLLAKYSASCILFLFITVLSTRILRTRWFLLWSILRWGGLRTQRCLPTVPCVMPESCISRSQSFESIIPPLFIDCWHKLMNIKWQIWMDDVGFARMHKQLINLACIVNASSPSPQPHEHGPSCSPQGYDTFSCMFFLNDIT